MKIGDKVKFEDPLNDTLIGTIIDKITPSCKCKGRGEWVINFEGYGKRSIKLNDVRLTKIANKTEVNKLGFKFT